MEIYIRGKRLLVDPTKIIGEGGEAEIFSLGPNFPHKLAKLWKPPTHPDFSGKDEQTIRNREGARKRIAENQHKIRAFPKNLPARVIVPEDLVLNRNDKQVLGYTMQHLQGADVLRQYSMRRFRQRINADGNTVMGIFKDLHRTVEALHSSNVVIADFNYLNVLVKGVEAFIIDADSMQFKSYLTRSFTPRFVDPLICDAALSALVQSAPHSKATDWYAFMVMLFESLLLVHPYGGVYEPKKGLLIPHDARPLKRISVFHSEVKYPSKAIPLGYLDDDLLHEFYATFEEGKRRILSPNLLEQRFTRCPHCGTEHARTKCPVCKEAVMPARKKVVMRGKVSLERIFETSGEIAVATQQNGKLYYLVHEGNEFRREGGQIVCRGTLERNMQFLLSGERTFIALNGQILEFTPGSIEPKRYAVDSYRNRHAVFDANAEHLYWLSAGKLMRDDPLAPAYVGDVLAGQTLIWVGPKFGVGLYRAGELRVGFIFDATRRGLNDSVKLVPFTGEVLDSASLFSGERAWLLLATYENGRVVHRCIVLAPNGQVLASHQAEENDGTWLGSLHGKVAMSQAKRHFLLSDHEDGLLRLEEQNGSIVTTATFPDTRGLIDPHANLLLDPNGILVVSQREIRRLTIRT